MTPTENPPAITAPSISGQPEVVTTQGEPPRGKGFVLPAQFLLLSAIWGSSFLFIKVGDAAFAPVLVSFGRMVFGSVTLLIIIALRRDRLPRGRAVWRHLIIASLLANVLPYTLFAYGETHVTSIVAGIWNATTPLLTLLVVLLTLAEERPSRERLAGLTIGFAGVLFVLGVWHGIGSQELVGNLACFAAAACYGLALPYVRRNLAGRSESTISLSAAQLLCGTGWLALALPFLGAQPHAWPVASILSIGALGALGTGIAYMLNYELLRKMGATTASMVTYIIPIFSTLIGVVILHEPLTWNQPVGALIVITGIAVSQGRIRLPISRSR